MTGRQCRAIIAGDGHVARPFRPGADRLSLRRPRPGHPVAGPGDRRPAGVPRPHPRRPSPAPCSTPPSPRGGRKGWPPPAHWRGRSTTSAA